LTYSLRRLSRKFFGVCWAYGNLRENLHGSLLDLDPQKYKNPITFNLFNSSLKHDFAP
jgi:hypothetical protein